MLKLIITFFIQRLFLLVIAFIAISIHSPLKTRFSLNLIWNEFLLKVSNNKEVYILKNLKTKNFSIAIKETRNPFIWTCRWLSDLTKVSEVVVLIIVSNIFLLLFFSELIALLCRMTTTDIAICSATLILFWPASYELSLGSEYALTCFLALVAIRYALENHWIFSGIALGIMMLYEPFAIGLILSLLFIFVYFQRHFMVSQIVHNAIFFLLPSLIAYFLGSVSFRGISIVDASLIKIIGAIINGNLNSLFSKPLLWQSFTFLFFGIGSVLSLIVNQLLIYKMVPFFIFLFFVLLTPYSMLASQASICAICLMPIASIGSPLNKLLYTIFFILSAIEVYNIFSG